MLREAPATLPNTRLRKDLRCSVRRRFYNPALTRRVRRASRLRPRHNPRGSTPSIRPIRTGYHWGGTNPLASICRMGAINKYWTGLRTMPGEAEREPHNKLIYRAPGWAIEFKPVHISYPALPKGLRRSVVGKAGPTRELFIHAPSYKRAREIAFLLYAADAVLRGIPNMSQLTGWDPFVAIPLDRQEVTTLDHDDQEFIRDTKETRPFWTQTNGFFDVALIATRLARDRMRSGASLRYLLSTYLAGLHFMDLHPNYGLRGNLRSTNPADWIWYSQSLFAAYGVIEDLELTPKASGNRPSILQDGTWNPEVRANLEARLGAIGIAPDDTIPWHIRGGTRRLDRKLQARGAQARKSPWFGGQVRDESLLYIDAINRANWLRSNVTAHRARDWLSSLSIIDVSNVQGLARMLLLKAVGFHFWKHIKVQWKTPPEKHAELQALNDALENGTLKPRVCR